MENINININNALDRYNELNDLLCQFNKFMKKFERLKNLPDLLNDMDTNDLEDIAGFVNALTDLKIEIEVLRDKMDMDELRDLDNLRKRYYL